MRKPCSVFCSEDEVGCIGCQMVPCRRLKIVVRQIALKGTSDEAGASMREIRDALISCGFSEKERFNFILGALNKIGSLHTSPTKTVTEEETVQAAA